MKLTKLRGAAMPREATCHGARFGEYLREGDFAATGSSALPADAQHAIAARLDAELLARLAERTR